MSGLGNTSKVWGSVLGDRPLSLDLPTSTSRSGQLEVASVAGDARFETLRRLCENGQVTESVRALEVLVQQESHVDRYLFQRVLKRCIAAKDLGLGRRVHVLIAEAGYHTDTFLANHTIRMYGSCGKLDEAMQVFTKVPAPDTFMWCSIISAHAECGQCSQAINLYRQMRQSPVKPNSYVYVAVLKACTSATDAATGKEVHAHIPESVIQSDKFVGTCLVDMYSKCGSLGDAREVFDKLLIKDVVTWTAMIAGYAKHGLGEEALGLYARMQQEGMTVGDRVTFMCLLQACASAGALNQGKQLHAQIQQRGLETNLAVGNCLVHMYAKCGSLAEARKVFDRMAMKDVVTWNVMMAGYAQHGLGQEALTLYASMRQECMTLATPATFVCLLEACASIQDLHQGKELHAQIQQRGLEADTTIGNCLVDMYAKCGSLEEARNVFNRLPSRGVVTWTAMIAGYAQHGLGQEALALYGDMQHDGRTPANHVTFTCLLKACASVRALHQGKQLHAQIQQQELIADGNLGTALVDMYAKCGSLEEARKVFHSLSVKDVSTWNSMIAACSELGLGQEALDMYASMQQEGATTANRVTFLCLLKSCAIVGALDQGKQLHAQIQQRGLDTDVVVGSCLVDMYAKCGSLEEARILFDSLPTRDVVTWTVMISGYVQHGFGHKALTLYASMLHEGVLLADKVMFVCLLNACADVGALHQGKQLHAQIQQVGLDADVAVCNSLLDMYAKCGSVEDAHRVFDTLPTRDVVTWNSLLNGYAQQSAGKKAMQLFEEMQQQGVKPDDVTFTCLLVACSHEGLVQEGQEYFRAMTKDHGVTPTVNHYSCMVDLLGRSGLLDDAENILETMPFKEDVVGWTSLLTACKIYGHIERGKRCFNRLIALEPESAVPYALMGNIYANAGRWKDVDEVERLRVSAGAWKKPAKACIEVNYNVKEFTVGDERADVSLKLRRINRRLKDEGGHVPQTELVLKVVSDKHKEDALCGHAEKLALAYGLLNTPDGTPLLVTKNLRMCNDCHSSTKIMSHLENREIVVRDAHRVHRFLEGSCSCGDRH